MQEINASEVEDTGQLWQQKLGSTRKMCTPNLTGWVQIHQ